MFVSLGLIVCKFVWDLKFVCFIVVVPTMITVYLLRGETKPHKLSRIRKDKKGTMYNVMLSNKTQSGKSQWEVKKGV